MNNILNRVNCGTIRIHHKALASLPDAREKRGTFSRVPGNEANIASTTYMYACVCETHTDCL